MEAERGRAKTLAAHLGVSKSRVSQIAKDGVPKVYMARIRDFTGNSVTLEDMLPEADEEVEAA